MKCNQSEIEHTIVGCIGRKKKQKQYPDINDQDTI